MDVNKTNRNTKSALGSLLNANSSKIPNLVPPVLHEVGKLAAGVASVSTTAGSATGNPRNKCALEPGHSLMDWIRLGNSGKDLTGVGSNAGHISVTRKELASHDKESDCWLAIRGKVYNVTEYLSFHPGGVDELMRGAGKDATSIFDEVHPWVNYESILQKCVIGRLVAMDPNINKEELFFGKDNFIVPKSPNNQAKAPKTPSPSQQLPNVNSNNNTNVNKPSVDASPKSSNTKDCVEPTVQTPEDETQPLPRFDWIQKLNSITVIFYTGAFCNPSVVITPLNEDNELNVILSYLNTTFTNEIQFLRPVQFPCKTKLYYETGKVEMVFTKHNSDIWDNYGFLRQKSKQMIQGGGKTTFVVADKQQVNHNIYLLKFERTDNCRYVIPIGKHVRVFVTKQGSEISRSYTAVPETLFSTYGPKSDTTDSVCLMVKRYPDGEVSKYITDLEIGDTVYTSRPLGYFNLERLEKMDKYILLAAGTGITPMLSLIVFLLDRRIRKCQSIALLFFNKKEEDIAFKNMFAQLAENDNRLRIQHILSEADENWRGAKGRVNLQLLNTTISKELKDTVYTHKDMFSCICGPNAFVDTSNNLLQQIGFTNDQIHCFEG